MFEEMLNWTLQRGSHHFPGPDGGTCINEAAIVAAGFEYQHIFNVELMPICFSRPICAFAMLLNDTIDHHSRQKLMKYVMRLSGSADSENIENQRRMVIKDRIRAGMEKIFMDSFIHPELLLVQESCLVDITISKDNMLNVFTRAFIALETELIRRSNDLELEDFIELSKSVVDIKIELATLGMEIMDEILSIGNQSSNQDHEAVKVRFDRIKNKATADATIS